MPGDVSKRARIILADDYVPAHELYRQMLEPEFEILAMVADGKAAVAAVEKQTPDVVVLDVSMPVMDGFAAAQQLKQEFPAVKIIFLTMHGETAYMNHAVEVGAQGYVLKWNAPDILLEAIRRVLQGDTYFRSKSVSNGT